MRDRPGSPGSSVKVARPRWPAPSPTPVRAGGSAASSSASSRRSPAPPGIAELRATVCGDNPRAVSLATRLAGARSTRWQDGAREFVLALY